MTASFGATPRTAGARPNRQWQTATTKDDLGRMKDHDFLEHLEAINVIGKNVKQVLQNDLLLRSVPAIRHRSKWTSTRAAGVMERLIMNIFQKF